MMIYSLGYSKIMPFAEAEEEVERIMGSIDKNNSNFIDYTGRNLYYDKK